MHVIHLHKECKAKKTSPVITTWRWPCPTKQKNVCLAQSQHAVTTLHVHGQLVMVYSGLQTLKSLWADMTQMLLNYGIICVDDNNMESLALPALDDSCLY